MTDGRPAEVWANARAERQATVGREPDDWNVVLRRQRRSDVLDGGLGLVVIAVVVPLLQIMDPQISAAEEISIGLLVAGLGVAALVHARRRLRWAHRWLANPLPWTEETRWT